MPLPGFHSSIYESGITRMYCFFLAIALMQFRRFHQFTKRIFHLPTRKIIHLYLPIYGPCQAKKCLRRCANVRIHIILRMRKVSPGPFQLIYSIVSSDSDSRQRKSWSDCANAQADLGLCCPLMPEDTFSQGSVHTTTRCQLTVSMEGKTPNRKIQIKWLSFGNVLCEDQRNKRQTEASKCILDKTNPETSYVPQKRKEFVGLYIILNTVNLHNPRL